MRRKIRQLKTLKADRSFAMIGLEPVILKATKYHEDEDSRDLTGALWIMVQALGCSMMGIQAFASRQSTTQRQVM